MHHNGTQKEIVITEAIVERGKDRQRIIFIFEIAMISFFISVAFMLATVFI